MSGIRIASRDVWWTYANQIAAAGVNVVLLPLLLWRLTPSEMGLWYVYSALGGLSVVLDFGLTATLSRHVTYAWCGVRAIEKEGLGGHVPTGEPNLPLLRSIVAATKLAYSLVGAAALLLSVTAGTWYVSHSAGASPFESELLSWWIYAGAIWLNTSMAYWNPLLRGVGAVADNGRANVAGKLTQLLLTSAALVAGYGLVGVSASYLASSFVFRFAARRYFYTRATHGGLDTATGESPQSRLELLKVIWPNALRQGVVSISQFLMTWSPVLVSSSFLGLHTAAAVGLTVQVIGVIKVFGNVLFNAYLPQFSSLRLSGDVAHLRSRVSLVLGTASYSILGLGALALTVSAPVLELLGTDVRLMALGPGLCFLLNEWATNQYALTSGYISTANKVPMHKAYILTAAAGVIGQVLATSILGWGIWGLVLPPLIASALYNDWIWFHFAAKDLALGSRRLLAQSFTEPLRFIAKRLGRN